MQYARACDEWQRRGADAVAATVASSFSSAISRQVTLKYTLPFESRFLTLVRKNLDEHVCTEMRDKSLHVLVSFLGLQLMFLTKLGWCFWPRSADEDDDAVSLAEVPNSCSVSKH